MMASKERKTAIIVGVLFLVALVASIVGGTMVDAVLGAPDYLAEITANESEVIIGSLLELTNSIMVIGIAVLLFPTLKRQDEGLALGYVALRIVEAGIFIAAIIGPMALVTLGQEYAAPGAADMPEIGRSFVAMRERLVGQLGGVFFSLGAFVLYYLLYQARLVPRFISLWGLVAVLLVLSWNLLKIFGVEVSAGIIFGLPIILNELVLAVWLIAKGFRSPSDIREPAAPAIGQV